MFIRRLAFLLLECEWVCFCVDCSVWLCCVNLNDIACIQISIIMPRWMTLSFVCIHFHRVHRLCYSIVAMVIANTPTIVLSSFRIDRIWNSSMQNTIWKYTTATKNAKSREKKTTLDVWCYENMYCIADRRLVNRNQ